MKPIFLSASIPDPMRNEKYYKSGNVIAIREAVTALVNTVTPRTPLVFGGHPAISPLIYYAAKNSDTLENVIIIQSEFFKNHIPMEVPYFKNILWTPVEENRESSLEIMRLMMLCEDYSSAFFIGGMEGVEDEFNMFREIHPQAPVYPISSTGGAAKFLLDNNKDLFTSEIAESLSEENVYSWLFLNLLKERG